MGFLDRLLGRPEPSRRQPYADPWAAGGRGTTGNAQDADERAIARYRYLLRTAPPETIEQAHAEAFAQLTPEQRRQVLTGLADDVPPADRSAGDDPRSLARMATRAELRRPGTLERVFGGPRSGPGMGGLGMGGAGMGVGGMIAGTLLASIAGTVIGSSIASAFLDDNDFTGDEGGDGSDAADGSGDEGSVETAGDFGGGGFGESPGGGYGGEYGGGFGGDFGGGDFGGDY